jgi:hypothetical protein
MSEGDKTFLPAGLPGLHTWEGVRADGWKSLTSLEEMTSWVLSACVLVMVSLWEFVDKEDVASGYSTVLHKGH